MSQQESKPVDPAAEREALDEAVAELKVAEKGTPEAQDQEDDEEEEEEGVDQAEQGAASQDPAKKKKKKSKKKKIKDALSSITSSSSTSAVPASADSPLPSSAINSLSSDQIQALVDANPALAQQLPKDPRAIKEFLKNMSAADLLTGLQGGKNAKDMASYKFWSTQPVTRFDETKGQQEPDGPIREVDIDKVRKEPGPLVDGFEWVEVDLEDPKEVSQLSCLRYLRSNKLLLQTDDGR